MTRSCLFVNILDDSTREDTECLTLSAVITSHNDNIVQLSSERTRICIVDNDGK